MRRRGSWIWAACLAGCGGDPGDGPMFGEGDGAAETSVGTDDDTGPMHPADTGEDDAGADDADASSDGAIFDVGTPGDDDDACGVTEDGDGLGPCDYQAPPDSFDAEVQWSWTLDPDGHRTGSTTIPLVANLTDDNDDGRIDLCDTPDIVVAVWDPDYEEHGVSFWDSQFFYVLDGATGSVHTRSETPINVRGQPALGDIDGDGVPEIITFVHHETTPGAKGRIAAWEHDGTHKWTSAFEMEGGAGATASSIGLADLDNDGDVEIYVGNWVYDHEGNHLWSAPGFAAQNGSTTAADLDDDGDLELVIGGVAYHHDGTVAWTSTVTTSAYPQIADLDDDGMPEVLLASDPLTILEHDGTTSALSIPGAWHRPATIHDVDGDDGPDIIAISGEDFSVFGAGGSPMWTASVWDPSGPSGGTAFDFLGDGTAEAMYADQEWMYAFGVGGTPELQVEHVSSTGLEYPVVADVDNDGSAEIVVISDRGWGGDGETPTVQVIRDADDRWVPARRIWNQHTYHVTNVREDGTIPQFEAPHWQQLNTFRTQAQIATAGGGTCRPEG